MRAENPANAFSFTECYLGKAGATNVILIAQTLNFQPSTVWLATARRSNDEPEW
jgi:hypothetical protein